MPRPDYNMSSPNPKRFYRSRRDRVLAGVCAGLAERFGWDATLVGLPQLFYFLLVAADRF